MEALKDVFTPFYERLRRPFVGAFWISWIFVNWKLWVALFFYKQTVGGLDKIEFIHAHLTTKSLILLPFAYAMSFIVIMPLFDYAAYYWGLAVRQQKRIIKFRFEGITPVEPQTHVKVVQEKLALEEKLAGIEEKYKSIASEAQRHKEFSLAHSRNLLRPSKGYFHGDWYVVGGSSKLRISFTEDYISIMRVDPISMDRDKREVFKIIDLIHKESVIYMQVVDYDSNVVFSEIWEVLFNNQKEQIRTVLSVDVSFLQINLDKLYKNDFCFRANGSPAEFNLVREGEFNFQNILFENDVDGLLPIKDRAKPRLDANAYGASL